MGVPDDSRQSLVLSGKLAPVNTKNLYMTPEKGSGTVSISTHTFYEGAEWAHGSTATHCFCVIAGKNPDPNPNPNPNSHLHSLPKWIVQQGAVHSPFHSQCTLRIFHCTHVASVTPRGCYVIIVLRVVKNLFESRPSAELPERGVNG